MPPIAMQPIENSSNLLALGYDAASQTLRVQFKGGTRYDYSDVPPEKFAELQAAESKGSFLNREIKSVCAVRKLESDEE